MEPLWALIVMLLFIIVYMEYLSRKERAQYLNLIDRLQNKIMSRDYSEYASQSRGKTGKNVTNPLMDQMVKNYAERDKAIRGDDGDG